MITNEAELAWAGASLQLMKTSLKILSDDLTITNPLLLPTVAGPYQRRIRALESDIAAYQAREDGDAPNTSDKSHQSELSDVSSVAPIPETANAA